ncbi:hypothetical protein [Elizabethkingia anophelis]|uniref:hypothetical protein n=1 Tax=Elizabethkingia anophelis TaxID=1117645 RepID=UPI00038A4E0C|nr:hypothetical protein [Elizabethkingia anophelis]EQB90579.1 hypothetical protein C874_16405 [Elizabethkingia anophelis 502]MCL1690469.1 hypothetical protein [Elizabethkingia anophelis]OPC33061.1 hypothetical protein BAX98_04260 [Elizabethkingia anophelis]
MNNRKDFVFSRIGMALVSVQRVEFITGKLLEYLVEYDCITSDITSSEFLEKAAKSKSGKRTLGNIFNLLKLNTELVIEEELDDYLKKRNILAHSFWSIYLQSDSDGKAAVEFCYDLGKNSEKIESFFKGFVYFLALKLVKEKDALDVEMKQWEKDFNYFMDSLTNNRLNKK